MTSSSSSQSRKKRKHSNSDGNILRCALPGLKKEIDIPFPPRKLPVCKKCKKIFKTRELCRVRDGHTDVPWKTTYICFVLDDSCVTTNEYGQSTLYPEDEVDYVAKPIDGPPVQYLAKSCDDMGGVSTPPICLTCKDKNYTRKNCREKLKHRQLPWGTAYVHLSAKQKQTKKQQEDKSTENKKTSKGDDEVSGTTTTSADQNEESSKAQSSVPQQGTGVARTIDYTDQTQLPFGQERIWKVESSKCFLLTISGDIKVLQWLVPAGTESTSRCAVVPPSNAIETTMPPQQHFPDDGHHGLPSYYPYNPHDHREGPPQMQQWGHMDRPPYGEYPPPPLPMNNQGYFHPDNNMNYYNGDHPSQQQHQGDMYYQHSPHPEQIYHEENNNANGPMYQRSSYYSQPRNTPSSHDHLSSGYDSYPDYHEPPHQRSRPNAEWMMSNNSNGQQQQPRQQYESPQDCGGSLPPPSQQIDHHHHPMQSNQKYRTGGGGVPPPPPPPPPQMVDIGIRTSDSSSGKFDQGIVERTVSTSHSYTSGGSTKVEEATPISL